MQFNEKLTSLRKSMGLSQEELGAELKVSRQTISKWESAQSYPDFQRLVLLSDYFGLTLDELVRDVDVADVRAKNLSSEKLDSMLFSGCGTSCGSWKTRLSQKPAAGRWKIPGAYMWFPLSRALAPPTGILTPGALSWALPEAWEGIT